MKLFTIGCSFTEGQGLKYQSFECYTTKLAEKLNLEYFNFGASGMSNDYIFRKVFELINTNTITKEDILIIQWTHYIRKELPFSYDGKKWFHSIPNSLHAYNDKVIIEFDKIKSVQNEYINQNLDDDRFLIESENKKILENYTLKFIDTEYQLNTTINYINSLYAYLEYFGYKHIHFFGWKQCTIESTILGKENFLTETFGGYTNTKTQHKNPEHPNKKGHLDWATFLYEEINKRQYLNIFESQLNNFRKELYRLHAEIEQDIENSNHKIKLQKQMDLDNEMEKIRKEKELYLQNQIEEDKIKLNVLKEEIKHQIEIEQEKLKSLLKSKPKSLI